MNSDFAEIKAGEKTQKPYHAPQLTVLGELQLVVQSNGGQGMDANFGHGGLGCTSAS